MLTVKPVDKLLNVFYDLKWATNTHMTPFTLTFKAYVTISMVWKTFFCSLIFLFLPVQITGLYIKLWLYVFSSAPEAPLPADVQLVLCF